MAGPVYVEDTELARQLSGMLGNVPGGGIQIANARSEIAFREAQRQKLLQDMAQERQVNEAKTQLPALASKVTAAEAVPPVPSYQKAWATGAGPIQSETVPLMGPAPLTAFDPVQEQQNVMATEARDKAIRDARTTLAQQGTTIAALTAKSPEDVTKLYGAYGTGLNLTGMAPKGSEEERRRQALTNPTAFGTPKEPINPYAAEHREPILDAASASMGSMTPAAADQIKNLLEDKYAPKTTVLQTPTGPAPQTVQQPMTPRDAALYDAATRLSRPPPAVAAPSPSAPPPPPPAAAAQAAPATADVGKTPATVSTDSGAPASVPKTENPVAAPTGAPAAAPAAAPAPTPPAAPKAFITPQGGATIGAPVSPHPTQDAERRVATAVQTAMPERQKIESILDFRADPKTGQMSINTANIPGYMASTIYKSPVGGFDVAQGIGQYLDTIEKGTPTTRAQDYYTAARAWVEPVLRLASGAAINQDEYRSYYAMFIPGPADSPQTAAEKLLRMRQWETAVASSSNAAQAMEKMLQVAPGREDVVKMRDVLNKNPDALVKPFTQILDQDAAAKGISGGATSAAPAARSSADQEALQWANANPTDPRAAQIKQRLGAR